MPEFNKGLRITKEGDGSNFDRSVLRSPNGLVGFKPEGGYISSWKVRNPATGAFENILYQGTTQKRTGIPLFFPYYGDAVGMKSHGFGRDSLWKIDHSEGNEALMTLSNRDISKDARAEYPHDFNAGLKLSIDANGSFIYDLKVANLGDHPLPISPGLHPYWSVTHSEKSKITEDGIPEFNATAIDWDTRPPDNVYPYNDPLIVRFPKTLLKLRILLTAVR